MATPDLWQSVSTPVCAESVREVAAPRTWSAPAALASEIPIKLSGSRRLSGADRFLKRSLDLVFSALAIVAVAPFLLVIAIAIRFDSPGPVFYISERVGKNGRRFPCLKFRTMVIDAEREQRRMLHLNERDGVLFKIAKDPRVTHVGRILRRYSLDELPQFVNVLRGEMSASEVQEYSPQQLERLAVLPGITGLWQTQCRHDPSFETYVSLDLAYIENWSVVLDLRIIAQTVRVVLAGVGI
jgi:lipopolysaccharide/colanic/teichoic acid biosynthesis glycosyltransferase